MSRFAFAAVLGVTAMASADFVGASYTEEVINPGEVTYKIFLNYDNPLDKQLAVSGNANFSALQFRPAPHSSKSTWCLQFLRTSPVLWPFPAIPG